MVRTGQSSPADLFARVRHLFFMAVPVFSIMSCLFYILISSAIQFTSGYHTRTNLYLNVWASGVTLGLSTILIIVVAIPAATLRVVNIIQSLFAGITFIFSLITFICYFITLIEYLVIITWGYNTVISLVLLHVFIARAIRRKPADIEELPLNDTTVQAEPPKTSRQEQNIINGFKFILWIGIALVSGVLCFGNAIFRAHYAVAYPKQGTMYTLASGQRMHLVCRGESDKITLVLETGQPAVASNSWKFIYDRLADRTRTCWYDRAGYGHSESGEYVRRADIIAKELHELLTVSGELDGKRKVVIAGQSWGGILARVFQKMFPESVGGLVLIDATTEYTTILDGQNKNITREDYIKEWRDQIRGIQILAITEAAGYTKVIFNLPAYYWSYYDKKNGGCQKAACYNPEAAADAFNNRFTLSAFSEMYYWSDSEDILLANNRTYHSLGDLPVGVFTAGSGVNGTCEMGGVDIFLELGLTKDKDAYCADWNKNIAVLGPEHLKKQEMMSQLSNNTVWKVYWNARHNIQWDFPEELTQDIMDVVNKATKQ